MKWFLSPKCYLLLMRIGRWAQPWSRALLTTAPHLGWGCTQGLRLRVAGARGNTRLLQSTASSTEGCSKKVGTRTDRAEAAVEDLRGQDEDRGLRTQRLHFQVWMSHTSNERGGIKSVTLNP